MLIREKYLKKIRPFYDVDIIKVLIGVRRSGKSFILKQITNELVDNGIDDSHIITIDFEGLEFAHIQNEMDLHLYIKNLIIDDHKYYLFFDEIQKVDNFEKALASFKSSLNVSIFITGSNSTLLSGELATLLTGRYVSFKIMPLSFKEFLEINNVTVTDQTRLKYELKDYFNEYMKWGGFPQITDFKDDNSKKTYLNGLYDSILLRDIIQRSQVSDVETLKNILDYLISTNTRMFSSESISAYFESINKKVSTRTIYSYLDAIINAQIFNKVQRYDIRGKRLLTRNDKYYLVDLGFTQVKNYGLKTDISAALETIVYNTLLSLDYEICVGVPKNGEIDFIAIKDNKRIYYQVTYLFTSKEVEDREFNVYKEIEDNFEKYVLSLDEFDFSQDGIIHKNIIEFLLEVE